MAHNIFSENFKKFRLAKNMTQEQVAERLCVNSQTVSRWECGTTLPDVLMLPKIARLYGVTVDDFYKKDSFGYANYAQRLSAVFENSHDPTDFMACRDEYIKMIKNGVLATEDKWMYGWIHMAMMCICRDTAMEWYQRAVDDDPETDPENHQIACMQRIALYFKLNRGDEIIAELKEKAAANPNSAEDTDYLIVALIWADRYDDAYELFCSVKDMFSDYYPLFIHGGDICKKLGRFDEALKLYERAGAIGTHFFDEYYAAADLYEQMGDYGKAYESYMNLADILKSKGYDVEAESAKKSAEEAIAHK